MRAYNDFLLEIGTEELPAKGLFNLATQLGEVFAQELTKAQLSFVAPQIFVTPRRLAILVKDLAMEQPAREIERKGPMLAAAFDEQQRPTKAAEGFARSCGVTVDQLQKSETPQGTWLVYRQKEAARPTAELLPTFIQKTIKQLTLPKTMRWYSEDEAFLRPVHWITALLGEQTIHCELFGIKSHNKTHGHRFHFPYAITLTHPNQYLKKLTGEGYVIPDFAARRAAISEQMQRLANSKACQVDLNEALLSEVTGLVEWPVALLGQFDERFIELPPEVIKATLEANQKSFTLWKDNKLQPYFITIANIESKNIAEVVKGNERVVHARLSDAEFFFQHDKQQKLENYLPQLEKVTFQQKLGSLSDKTARIMKLAEHIAKLLDYNVDEAVRAAKLVKTDLVTTMVGEFPELQGVMGSYYAKAEDESPVVANAIKEHYMPRFAGDDLPHSKAGQVVALADRLDTLVGIFGINQLPTGDKDPFALRRAAVGVLRILIECQLPLDLKELLNYAKESYKNTLPNAEVVQQTFDFMMERLRAWYGERNIPADVFAAVYAKNPTKPLDFHKRILAVNEFRQLPQAQALAAANKRVSNILKEITIEGEVDAKLLKEDAERKLHQLVIEKTKAIAPELQSGNYTKALVSLAELQQLVDAFFDHVMVMVDDMDLRNNRLRLLANLGKLFLNIADISLLQ